MLVRMNKLASLGVGFMLLLAVALIAPIHVAAEGRLTTVAHMSRGNFRASAVWTGAEFMILGGRDESTVWADVSVFNPDTRVFEDKALLPDSSMSAPAIWTGTYAFIFAGINQTATTIAAMKDTILRYDPATNSTIQMTPIFPSPRIGTSAGWDGNNAYIFGGFNSTAYLTDIFRYDVSGDTLQLMSSVLPYGLAGSSAVWTGDSFYIFGGRTGPIFHDQIVKFEPETGAVSVLGSRLPGARYHTSATWFKGNAYVFGGRDANGTLDQIVRFTPSTGIVKLLPIRLPIDREYTSSATDGKSIYVFGGNTDADYALKEILRFEPDFVEATDAIFGMLAIALVFVLVVFALVVLLRRRNDRSKEKTK